MEKRIFNTIISAAALIIAFAVITVKAVSQGEPERKYFAAVRSKSEVNEPPKLKERVAKDLMSEGGGGYGMYGGGMGGYGGGGYGPPAAGSQPRMSEEEMIRLMKADQAAQAEMQGGGYGGGGYGPGMGGYGGGMGRYGGMGGYGPGSDMGMQKQDIIPEPMLFIPAAETDSNAIKDVKKDLWTMSKIFDEKIGAPPLRRAVSSEPLIEIYAQRVGAGDRSTATQPIYIAGYGAIFSMSVDFCLVANIKPAEESQDKNGDIWENTQRELMAPVPSGPSGEKERIKRIESHYDKTKKLQETITETLKYAGNIKGVKTNEFVTVYIRGMNPGRYDKISCIVMRAKKTDIDRYLSGEINAEQFGKTLKITTY